MLLNLYNICCKTYRGHKTRKKFVILSYNSLGKLRISLFCGPVIMVAAPNIFNYAKAICPFCHRRILKENPTCSRKLQDKI